MKSDTPENGLSDRIDKNIPWCIYGLIQLACIRTNKTALICECIFDSCLESLQCGLRKLRSGNRDKLESFFIIQKTTTTTNIYMFQVLIRI